MNKQFTASEVRRTAAAIEGKQMLVSSMLRAYADRLEADEKAVPVAWRTFDGEGNYDYRDYENNEHYRDWYVSRNGAKYANWVEPLYSHPAPSDAERLAEALRDCIRDLRIAAEYGKTMRNPKALLETVERAEAALVAHSSQAQPPATRVPDEMVMRLKHALPLFCADVTMADARAALEAALAAQENPNG